MFLLHSGFEWIFSGAIVFIGLIVFMRHIAKGAIFNVIAGACVWVFVYKIHSGSTQGIMTATWAALLFDLFGMRLLRR